MIKKLFMLGLMVSITMVVKASEQKGSVDFAQLARERQVREREKRNQQTPQQVEQSESFPAAQQRTGGLTPGKLPEHGEGPVQHPAVPADTGEHQELNDQAIRLEFTRSFQQLLVDDFEKKKHNNELSYAQYLLEVFSKFVPEESLRSQDYQAASACLNTLCTISKSNNATEFFKFLSDDLKKIQLINSVIGDDIEILINYILFKIPELDSNINESVVKEAIRKSIQFYHTQSLDNITNFLLPRFSTCAHDEVFVRSIESASLQLLQEKQIGCFIQVCEFLKTIDRNRKKTLITEENDENNVLTRLLRSAYDYYLTNLMEKPDEMLSLSVIFNETDYMEDALDALKAKMPKAKNLM